MHDEADREKTVLLPEVGKDELTEDDGEATDESEPETKTAPQQPPPGVTAEGDDGPAGPAAAEDAGHLDGHEEPEPPRRRKAVLVAVAGAVVVVVVAGALVLMNRDTGADESGGVVTGAKPSAQAALAAPSVTGRPAPGDSGAGAVAEEPAPSSTGTSSGPGAQPSGPVSATASSPATGDVSQGATPSFSASGAAATPDPTDGPSTTGGHPVLKEGDQGPEVIELQKRLGQLLLQYIGLPDGEYDAGVERAVARYQDEHDIEGDPKGVYGPATRSDLESRTREP